MTTMEYKRIILKKGKEESLNRFHPWVFSGAISEYDGSIEEGDCVSVYTHNNTFVGNGHFQIGSIAIRILDFSQTELGKSFFKIRLEEAYKMRMKIGVITDINKSYRLVHGEGDFVPGLVIDIYGNTAVIQAHSPGIHYARNIVAEALIEVPEIGITNVYYKSETTLPYKAALDAQNGYLIGNYTSDITIENGLKFRIDWLKGQKTGFFIDQRDNRMLLQSLSNGKTVLNMFCYTGGFSVYAMRGNACQVHSVDSSSKAIQLTNANIDINFPGDTRHTAFATDAFKYLADMPSDYYDLIILDPPAFAKHKSALKNALIGYKKLNSKAFEKIKSGGILFTFSCSQAVSKEQFRLAVFSAAAISKRKVRILHQLTQPADHPINIYHPEGEYLKGLVLYVE